MPSTSIDLPDVPTTYYDYKPWFHNQRMRMVTDGGNYRFSFPFAPRDIEYGGLGGEWVEAERTGTTPLLMRKSTQLPTMRFSVIITHPRIMHWRQNGPLAALRKLIATRQRVLVRYSTAESGVWRITEATISSVMRHPSTSDITRAVVSLTLTRASDAAPRVGPVSGGKKQSAPKPKTKSKPPRKYTVKRGDTLWSIANKYYGSGARWPRIYDANRKRIKNPHRITPGIVLVIP